MHVFYAISIVGQHSHRKRLHCRSRALPQLPEVVQWLSGLLLCRSLTSPTEITQNKTTTTKINLVNFQNKSNFIFILQFKNAAILVYVYVMWCYECERDENKQQQKNTEMTECNKVLLATCQVANLPFKAKSQNWTRTIHQQPQFTIKC